MNQSIGNTAIILGSIAWLGLVGCGGKESMASRSAAAYRKTVQEGIPIAGEGHGEPMAAETAAVDHAAMGHVAQPQPVDHAAMGHGAQTQRMDHAAMGHGTATQPQQQAMDHAAMGAGTQPQQQPMDHAAHAAAPQTAELQSAEAQPGQPAATLRPDRLDAPALTSVIDAKRSAAMAREGHMQHGSTIYRQTDAGREPVTAPQGAHQHQAPPPKPPGGREEKR